jgi:putative ABC transport system permease protein
MPDWKPRIRRQLAGLHFEGAREEEIVEELAQHLEERYRELLAGGTPEDEARRLVEGELAPGEALSEALRRVERPADPRPPVLGGPTSTRWLEGLSSDTRYGLRALRKSPVFTAVAVATLALGIGANAAVFSVIDAVLLRPLPFPEPDRLVTFWGSAPAMGLPVVAYPDAFYVYFRSRSHTLDSLAMYSSFGMTLRGEGDPERVRSAAVTVDFFRLLGQVPLYGRTFLPEEVLRDRNHVAVLSYSLWQRRFGGDPGVVGKSVVMDGVPGTVVGIMPPGFGFPAATRHTELWVPLGIDPESLNCWCLTPVARLASGRTPSDAAGEIARLSDDFWRDREGKPRTDPASPEPAKSIVYAEPLARSLVGEVKTPLLVLLGAVGMVLLIACANVANLLLARATVRYHEIAVRCCLGASPFRIGRQLLVESLLLALGGAAIGLVLGLWAVRAVSRLLMERVPYVHPIGLDPKVLLFTLGVTLATGVLFGLAPALSAARIDLQEGVREGSRASHGARSRRLHHAFVVSQFALSLVLLVGAGLLFRSFRNLLEVELGFRPENVIVARASLPHPASDDPARSRAFFPQLAERVSGLPGVRAVGLSSNAPFSDGDNQQIFMIKGREPAPGEPDLVASVRSVTPGYFAAVGTPVLRGRGLEESDGSSSPPVAVVDDALARRFWPDGNAVGQQVRLGDKSSKNPWLTIVGVAASIKHGDLRDDPDRYVYVPFAQTPLSSMELVVRTASDPADSTDAIRGEVRSLDPTVPVHDVHTLEDAIARSVETRRVTNLLILGFAMIALALAAVGIYGVMALNVTHRVSEFGIRLALGAAPGDVLTLVLGQGLRLVVLGVVLGLFGAVAVGRLLRSLLFQVKPLDPATFACVALVLAVVALLACYLPARRATATDPLVALRYE